MDVTRQKERWPWPDGSSFLACFCTICELSGSGPWAKRPRTLLVTCPGFGLSTVKPGGYEEIILKVFLSSVLMWLLSRWTIIFLVWCSCPDLPAEGTQGWVLCSGLGRGWRKRRSGELTGARAVEGARATPDRSVDSPSPCQQLKPPGPTCSPSQGAAYLGKRHLWELHSKVWGKHSHLLLAYLTSWDHPPSILAFAFWNCPVQHGSHWIHVFLFFS